MTVPGPGPNDDAVSYWMPKILAENLNWPSNEDIKKELKECGAWDSEELENIDKNNQRIVWIACHNIKEEINLEEKLEDCDKE